MFYAAYRDIEDSDIAVFPTERERDDWVSYKDPFSKAFDVNSGNSTFQRIKLETSMAEMQVKNMIYGQDGFNSNQGWYYYD